MSPLETTIGAVVVVATSPFHAAAAVVVEVVMVEASCLVAYHVQTTPSADRLVATHLRERSPATNILAIGILSTNSTIRAVKVEDVQAVILTVSKPTTKMIRIRNLSMNGLHRVSPMLLGSPTVVDLVVVHHVVPAVDLVDSSSTTTETVVGTTEHVNIAKNV
jgi:hypothetical protein